MYEKKQAVINAAKSMRITLWCLIVLTVLCLLGVPTIFNVEVEPLKNNDWLMFGYMVYDSLFLSGLEPGMEMTQMHLSQQLLFSLLFLVPLLVTAFLIWHIDRLFRQYTLGNIFTEQCIRHFYLIGWSLVALFVMNTIGGTVLDLFYPVPVQMEVLPFSKSDEVVVGEFDGFYGFFIALDFSLLVSGLFIVAVSRVMQLGVMLQEDVDATV